MLTKMIKVNWILDRTKKKQKWRRDTRRECKQQSNTKGTKLEFMRQKQSIKSSSFGL